MAHLQMALEEGPILPHLSLLDALNVGGDNSFPLSGHARLLKMNEFGFGSPVGFSHQYGFRCRLGIRYGLERRRRETAAVHKARGKCTHRDIHGQT